MTQNGIVLVVSATIFKNDEVLIIKENKPIAVDQWNFPGGRIEFGEDILLAACREVKEETGLSVELLNSTGIYNFISSTGNQVILFHFTGKISAGTLNIEEEEIIDSRWVEISEILNFDNKELRNANVIKQIVNNLIDRNFHSINIVNPQLRNKYSY